MFPPAGPARWRALRRQAEAMASWTPGSSPATPFSAKERRWPEWIEGQKLKFRRALDALEAEAEVSAIPSTSARSPSAARSATSISATATTTGGRRGPRLAGWLERFSERPSMARTAPVEIW